MAALDTQSILRILDTPFFRKWIQNKCNESIELFNDPGNDAKLNDPSTMECNLPSMQTD
jgi:hypothetical protein